MSLGRFLRIIDPQDKTHNAEESGRRCAPCFGWLIFLVSDSTRFLRGVRSPRGVGAPLLLLCALVVPDAELGVVACWIVGRRSPCGRPRFGLDTLRCSVTLWLVVCALAVRICCFWVQWLMRNDPRSGGSGGLRGWPSYRDGQNF